MFPSLKHPSCVLLQVQSLSCVQSGLFVHRSWLSVACRNCRYCQWASVPPLCLSNEATVAFRSPAIDHGVVVDLQSCVILFQNDLLSPSSPGFHGAYAPKMQWGRHLPSAVGRIISSMITLPFRDFCLISNHWATWMSLHMPITIPYLKMWWFSACLPASSYISYSEQGRELFNSACLGLANDECMRTPHINDIVDVVELDGLDEAISI